MAQTQRIRFQAGRLVDRFLSGHAVIDTSAPVSKLAFDFFQSDVDQCPEHLRAWSEYLARNNLQLIHHHAHNWIVNGTNPPNQEFRQCCRRYINLRERLDT